MHRTADDFIGLLEPHYNSAVQYCRALYINRKDAEDGLQDAIISAIQHFRSLRDDSKFRSWFFTIITRTFYSSRLSRLSYKIFNQHIDATGASNEQLNTEIETKLKETGLHNLKVQLVEENGRKQVKFIPNGQARNFSIDLTLRDGSNVTAIAENW